MTQIGTALAKFLHEAGKERSWTSKGEYKQRQKRETYVVAMLNVKDVMYFIIWLASPHQK